MATLFFSIAILFMLPPAASAAPGTTSHRTARKSSTSHASTKKAVRHARKRHKAKRSWRSRGQHGIQAERARQIQEALIREKYFNGDADGVWGKASQEAMARYQADNGWQSKVVPDARALIKLGLGPDRTSVINPESLRSSLVPQPRGGQD